jgi:peroxiredoxin
MIKVGDRIPGVKVKVAGESGGGDEVNTEALWANKKVVIFGLPGAFTPTCSAKHLPGFVERADEILAKGVDMIACVSVNDAFVMGAWGKDQKAFGKITMVADGNGDLARAMGLELDLTASGMGVRNKRYAAIVDGGVVKSLEVEEPGKFEVSSAEAVLKKLG